MNKKLPLAIFAFFAAFIIVTDAFFVVKETKQAVILQFGEPMRTIRQAGLYFKIPLIQQALQFEKRVLDVDLEPERVMLASSDDNFLGTLAKETVDANVAKSEFNDSGAPIIVDTYARYRITDPLKFYQRLSTEEAARLRISNEVDSTTRDVLGRSTIEQLLSKERSKLMEQIKARVNKAVSDLGIEIVDVRINRADLPDSLQLATFNRMRSERDQRAKEIRSMGEKRALEIRANADKDRTILVADAQRQAQILKGQGDEEASKIYAKAYERDPNFYAFYRSLDAYKQTLSRKETTLILSPDSQFFDILRGR